jgi:hypothetical protein
MRRLPWLAALLLVCGAALYVPAGTAGPEEVSCECPKTDCGQCAEEQGLTFYSEKCGPGLTKVKSCARPTCVALENPPPSCKKADAAAGDAARKPALAEQPKKNLERGPLIGTIKAVEGEAWLKWPDGNKEKIAVGMALHERDTLQTERAGKVHVEFKDGNLVQVQNDSMVKIDQYEMAEEKRKAVINLLRGQIRNQVKQKYNGQTSSYQIKTKTAVAGVRGTDFVAGFKEGEKLETEIKTLEGKVVLANQDYSQSLEITEGQQAAYVVAASSVFGQDEINEFVARGYMTPVYKMTDAELAKLDAGTRVGETGKREIAAAKKMICKEPKAELNQCSWHCENNPKSEKSCRTDMPDVSCVRRRCNANGEWAEETRTPASSKDQCASHGFKVAPCDY